MKVQRTAAFSLFILIAASHAWAGVHCTSGQPTLQSCANVTPSDIARDLIELVKAGEPQDQGVKACRDRLALPVVCGPGIFTQATLLKRTGREANCDTQSGQICLDETDRVELIGQPVRIKKMGVETNEFRAKYRITKASQPGAGEYVGQFEFVLNSEDTMIQGTGCGFILTEPTQKFISRTCWSGQ